MGHKGYDTRMPKPCIVKFTNHIVKLISFLFTFTNADMLAFNIFGYREPSVMVLLLLSLFFVEKTTVA